MKGNVSIEALVSKDHLFSVQDGYEVIDPAEILSRDFDYIIVASSRYYNEIAEDAEIIMGGGDIKKKIINGAVLYIPGFDFTDYIKLRENPVSIITNDCLGGILYHYLNLEFSSPFINCAIDADDFLQLVNHLEEYMKQPLLPEQEGDIYQCPVGTLTYLDNKIRIYFNHAYSFDEAKKDFERRRNRINWNNIFICSNASRKEYAENFAKLPYRKKSITAEDFGAVDSVMLWGYKHEYSKRQNDAAQAREFRRYTQNMRNITKEINVFRMLLGEDGIRRNY
ncbi:MAG: DUF1919 domain-containing protein [Lachnospiraceae bacterium]|nr:DUF1919 domain-containing protein [Lachnospiraceae bacterium]